MNMMPKHWREYLQDMSLSTVLFKESIRHKRLTEWELHVNAYKALKAHLVLPSLPGTEGIDFIAGHFDILARKLGSLLTFHGMLAAVVGLYLNVFLSGPRRAAFWLVLGVRGCVDGHHVALSVGDGLGAVG